MQPPPGFLKRYGSFCRRVAEWEWATVYGQSDFPRRCRRASDDDDDDDEVVGYEDDYWVDTKMLLMLLLHWCRNRRGASLKAMVQQVAKHLLSLIFGAEVCSLSCINKTRGPHISLCRQGCYEDHELCTCLLSALQAILNLSSVGQTSGAALFDKLVTLADHAAECASVFSILAQAMESVADQIQDRKDTWGNFDLLRKELCLVGRSGEKRRRLDGPVKSQIVSAALMEGKAQRPSDVARVVGLSTSSSVDEWSEQAVMHQVASGYLSYLVPGIHSIAIDGAQIGKPFKDYLLIHHNRWPNQNMVLPPKESGLSLWFVVVFGCCLFFVQSPLA